jgi:hypothetical protein
MNPEACNRAANFAFRFRVTRNPTPRITMSTAQDAIT